LATLSLDAIKDFPPDGSVRAEAFRNDLIGRNIVRVYLRYPRANLF